MEELREGCTSLRGHVAWEWPRACTYWQDDKVRELSQDLGCKSYDFDGCRFNLRSRVKKTYGSLLKKPWRIMSTCEEFWRLCLKCNHKKEEHVRVQGKDTRNTESYTDELVHSIHTCWGCHCA